MKLKRKNKFFNAVGSKERIITQKRKVFDIVRNLKILTNGDNRLTTRLRKEKLICLQV